MIFRFTLAPCPLCTSTRVAWTGNIQNMVFCRACDLRAASPEEWEEKRALMNSMRLQDADDALQGAG